MKGYIHSPIQFYPDLIKIGKTTNLEAFKLKDGTPTYDVVEDEEERQVPRRERKKRPPFLFSMVEIGADFSQNRIPLHDRR